MTRLAVIFFVIAYILHIRQKEKEEKDNKDD